MFQTVFYGTFSLFQVFLENIYVTKNYSNKKKNKIQNKKNHLTVKADMIT